MPQIDPPAGAATVEDMFAHLEDMRVHRANGDPDSVELHPRVLEGEATATMTLLLECPPDTCEWTRNDLEPVRGE